jgi:MATE family multidrug resistance protein
MLQVIFVSFLFMGSGFGDVTLAANQVLLQFLSITAHALDGFAFSAEALVGQAYGARNRAILRRSAIMASQWGLVVCVALAIGFAVFGGMIIDVMAKAPAVQETARTYLVYMVLAPVLGLAAYMLDGVFIGATRSRDMRNMMAVSLVIYGIAVAVLVPVMGNHGLWLALLISFVARGVTLGLRYPVLEQGMTGEGGNNR